MSKTMKAARYHAKGDLRVEDVPIPTPRQGEVLVEVEWCGICGSDLHDYITGPSMVIPTPENPHPLTGGHIPLTMGHEMCGRVKQAGPGSKLKVGQAVMVDPRMTCNSCKPCSTRHDNHCHKLGFLGLAGGHGGGGFSEFAAVREDRCYALPDGANLDVVALIEPLSVGKHALTCSGCNDFTGLDVLVIGGGPVGLAVMYNLRAAGVAQIIASEPTAKRQKWAADIADVTLNPMEVDIAQECRNRTNEEGVDMVFDCAGIQPGLDAGIDALRRGGVYVNVAGWEKPMEVSMLAMLKEITIRYSMAYDSTDFKQTFDEFVAGKFAGAEKMVTDRIALKDIQKKGFDELIDHKDDQVKILVTPKAALIS